MQKKNLVHCIYFYFFSGTYKIQKTELRNEGFDVNIVKDKLYFKNPKTGFVPLTESLYTNIINGAVKV